jgi:preprotein translocase subunit SecB
MEKMESKQGIPQSLLHPVQLVFISIRELHFRAKRPLDPRSPPDYGGQFKFNHHHSDFKGEFKQIQVSFQVEMGSPETPNEWFELRVDIVGQFEVDTSKLPAEKVPQWAANAAPFVLYPFVRQHVYDLTLRGGCPVLLPLFNLPTVKA